MGACCGGMKTHQHKSLPEKNKTAAAHKEDQQKNSDVALNDKTAVSGDAVENQTVPDNGDVKQLEVATMLTPVSSEPPQQNGSMPDAAQLNHVEPEGQQPPDVTANGPAVSAEPPSVEVSEEIAVTTSNQHQLSSEPPSATSAADDAGSEPVAVEAVQLCISEEGDLEKSHTITTTTITTTTASGAVEVTTEVSEEVKESMVATVEQEPASVDTAAAVDAPPEIVIDEEIRPLVEETVEAAVPYEPETVQANVEVAQKVPVASDELESHTDAGVEVTTANAEQPSCEVVVAEESQTATVVSSEESSPQVAAEEVMQAPADETIPPPPPATEPPVEDQEETAASTTEVIVEEPATESAGQAVESNPNEVISESIELPEQPVNAAVDESSASAVVEEGEPIQQLTATESKPDELVTEPETMPKPPEEATVQPSVEEVVHDVPSPEPMAAEYEVPVPASEVSSETVVQAESSETSIQQEQTESILVGEPEQQPSEQTILTPEELPVPIASQLVESAPLPTEDSLNVPSTVEHEAVAEQQSAAEELKPEELIIEPETVPQQPEAEIVQDVPVESQSQLVDVGENDAGVAADDTPLPPPPQSMEPVPLPEQMDAQTPETPVNNEDVLPPPPPPEVLEFDSSAPDTVVKEPQVAADSENTAAAVEVLDGVTAETSPSEDSVTASPTSDESTTSSEKVTSDEMTTEAVSISPETAISAEA